MVDLAGRADVAVAYDQGGIRRELLLDPRPYEYHGDRTVATRDAPEPGSRARAGQVMDASARITSRVVGRCGARS